MTGDLSFHRGISHFKANGKCASPKINYVPSKFAGAPTMDMWRDSLRRIPPIGFFLVEVRGVGAEGAPTRFMVASGGVLSEGYEHG